MSLTTYPKIAAKGIPMQLGFDSSRPLPRVHTHPVHMTNISIVILYSKTLMHRPHHNMFPVVLIISVGAFAEFGHDSTRNMICV
jgi:hypothetical protein